MVLVPGDAIEIAILFKGHPAFFFRIVLFLLLGMRGNTILFKRYINYSTDSAKQWADILSRVLREKIEIETANG